MPVLDETEIVPGLVVELDPVVLSQCPGVLTNARQAKGGSRVANRPGPFIVLASEARGWLCAPTFSNGYPSFDLDPKLQGGPLQKWRSQTSYFNKFQFWIIPSSCLIAASEKDRCVKGARCSYASGNPDELARIADYRNESDAGFEPISN